MRSAPRRSRSAKPSPACGGGLGGGGPHQAGARFNPGTPPRPRPHQLLARPGRWQATRRSPSRHHFCNPVSTSAPPAPRLRRQTQLRGMHPPEPAPASLLQHRLDPDLGPTGSSTAPAGAAERQATRRSPSRRHFCGAASTPAPPAPAGATERQTPRRSPPASLLQRRLDLGSTGSSPAPAGAAERHAPRRSPSRRHSCNPVSTSAPPAPRPPRQAQPRGRRPVGDRPGVTSADPPGPTGSSPSPAGAWERQARPLTPAAPPPPRRRSRAARHRRRADPPASAPPARRRRR